MLKVLKYGSVCSGIEAASVAWEPLGMAPSWFSEIEQFPSAIIKHHWPLVQNLGDMRGLALRIRAGEVEAPDVLVGGTPCQAFSVAGLRGGLNDRRGQLTLTYVDILNAIDQQRPNEEAVCVWENVPGVLSSRDNAFGCFLAALAGEDVPLKPPGRKWENAGCVFGPQRAIAWRVLDAQYFGMAQRRKRVFVVASARKGFDPASVLFESEGVRRDTPPSREAGEGPTTGANDGFTFSRTVGALDTQCGLSQQTHQSFSSGHYVLERPVRGTLTARMFNALGARDVEEGALIPFSAYNQSIESAGISQAVASRNDQDTASCVITKDLGSLSVRKLTPVECERLQGFPDDYTKIPFRGKSADKCPDGPRYKAIGNSKAVPVVRFIGRRLLRELDVVSFL